MLAPSFNLVLASSSPFRQQLLEKLGLPFTSHSPDIDESRKENESAQALVQRLAFEKAHAVAQAHPNSLIIGSDQVAISADGEILGKPGTEEKAIAQLQKTSGTKVVFATGLCLLNSATGKAHIACEEFSVQFRELSTQVIERYVAQEQPLNSAGSFKSEGLGIVLFHALEGRDPNALVGLPLIQLTDFLANEGVILPLAR